MNKCILIAGFVATLMMPCDTIHAQGNLPQNNANSSIDEVIDNYINACGGHALSAIKTESRRGTLLRGRVGKVPLEVSAKGPDSWKYLQKFAWGDRVCYGYDGTSGWVQDTVSITEMPRDQLEDFRLLFDIQAPLKLREWYPQMEIIGTEQVDSQGVVTARATSRSGDTITMDFDAATGLLRRAGQIVFEDYRDIGGIKRPFKILLGENAEDKMQMVMEFTEIRQDQEFDEGLFQRPVCALPVTESPLFKERQDVEVDIGELEACAGVYQHPADSTVTYTVTRQQNHLMIKRTGWGQKLEIKPESDTDYYMEFLGWDFHFDLDDAGRANQMTIEAGNKMVAKRIQED